MFPIHGQVMFKLCMLTSLRTNALRKFNHMRWKSFWNILHKWTLSLKEHLEYAYFSRLKVIFVEPSNCILKHSDFLEGWWDWATVKPVACGLTRCYFLVLTCLGDPRWYPVRWAIRGHGQCCFTHSPPHFQFASSCCHPGNQITRLIWDLKDSKSEAKRGQKHLSCELSTYILVPGFNLDFDTQWSLCFWLFI